MNPLSSQIAIRERVNEGHRQAQQQRAVARARARRRGTARPPRRQLLAIARRLAGLEAA